MDTKPGSAARDLLSHVGDDVFQTVMADPPWRFLNRSGKIAPEHKRLTRYETMTTEEICELPVRDVTVEPAHLYLWVPNALLPDGLRVMEAWGFEYKSNVVWHKIRKDGGSDGRGVGFYFRNVTEPDPVRRARQECSHARACAQPSEHDPIAQARTLTQARRTVRTDRAVFARSLSGIVRPRHSPRLDLLG